MNRRPPGQRPGRAKGTRNRKTAIQIERIEEILARVGCDPIEGLARMAVGDVVMLGYMTEKELQEPATFDRQGRVVRPSGMERALDYVSPQLRFHAYKELANYVYPKRSTIAHTDPNGKPMQAAVVVALPPNDR